MKRDSSRKSVVVEKSGSALTTNVCLKRKVRDEFATRGKSISAVSKRKPSTGNPATDDLCDKEDANLMNAVVTASALSASK